MQKPTTPKNTSTPVSNAPGVCVASSRRSKREKARALGSTQEEPKAYATSLYAGGPEIFQEELDFDFAETQVCGNQGNFYRNLHKNSPPLLERAEEIEVAGAIQNSKKDLLELLLSTRETIRWMAEADPRRNGLSLQKKDQAALLRVLRDGDARFSEVQSNPFCNSLEAMDPVLKEVRHVLGNLKFQYARMEELLEKFEGWRKQLKQLRAFVIGDNRGIEGHLRSLESQLWIREDALETFFERLQHRENRFLKNRSRLVEANLRLVPHCAKKFSYAQVAPEDLIQEGFAALTLAAENYQPEMAKFSTFATKVVHSTLIRTVDDQGLLIRIPVHACETLRKIRKTAEALEKSLGREATEAEIAAKCKVKTEKVRELQIAAQPAVSLDALLTVNPLAESDPASNHSDPQHPGPAQAVDSRLLHSMEIDEAALQMLHERLEKLPDDHREIVERLYGLGDFGSCSERDVALCLNRTEAEIRRIHARALALLRLGENLQSGSPANEEEQMYGIAA